MKILAVNCGSSTLKFRLYEMPLEKVIAKGSFERIGLSGSNYTITVGEEKFKVEKQMESHDDAVSLLLEELLEKGIVSSLEEIASVGHRIVHGKDKYAQSTVLTEEDINEISSFSDLAPLHNPSCLLGVKVFQEKIPTATMVGCFDTAFHQTMKEEEYLYPVPYTWYKDYGVRKYGFHGMSHRYITGKMKEVLGEDKNLVICHIGNGASLSAVKNGQCIDTSMGFTPNAGVMMGTRSGDIDYSMIGYIMKKTNQTYQEIDTELNKQSGLEGIAGMSDLRDIDMEFDKGNPKVELAVSMYTSRISEYIAKYLLKLGKIDAIVFTAGVGENDPMIREEVLKKLAPLGVVIDLDANQEMLVRKGKEGKISKEESAIACYVFGTDEEVMIARDAYQFVKE